MTATRRLLQWSARVFCPQSGSVGGNPVTIFRGPPVAPSTRQAWAKTCEWESVVVEESKEVPRLYFYMPTGENVSFCAHAAMGAATTLTDLYARTLSFSARQDASNESTEYTFELHRDGTSNEAKDVDATINNDSLYSRIVSLQFTDVPYTESAVEHMPTLMRILREHHSIAPTSLSPTTILESGLSLPPSCINASVARPKTLVPLKTTDQVHACHASPRLERYAAACDMIGSTGIYVYAPLENERGSWEARQFPRASGYGKRDNSCVIRFDCMLTLRSAVQSRFVLAS
jgi:predicted PhzF superfamily epimerase YddE/YHI9